MSSVLQMRKWRPCDLEALYNFLKHHTLSKASVLPSYVSLPIIVTLSASISYMYHTLALTLATQGPDSIGIVFSWATDPDDYAV